MQVRSLLAVFNRLDSMGEMFGQGRNLTGLFLTVVLIVFCWVVSFFINKKHIFNDLSEVFARKFVHIGVSNFAFIYLNFFTSYLIPFAGLVFFALINLGIELVKKNVLKKTACWGTVEYPFIIAVLILCVHLGIGKDLYVACALLGMGYGDGFAAVCGMLIKGHRMPFNRKKTIAGAATVFTVVLFVCLMFRQNTVLSALLIALSSALTESYTPFNLDNLTVPVVIFFLMGVLS